MAERPKLVKVDADMQRWSATIADEVASWPHVTSRPMFGMRAFYRDTAIFAALPRTRAAGTPFSLLVKLSNVTSRRLSIGRGPGAKWAALALNSEADIPEALRCLGRAYEQAAKKRR